MKKTINRYVTTSALKFVQNLCEPLKKIGILGFCHDITFEKGSMSMLTNDIDLFSIYFTDRFPLTCVDDSGRTLDAGIYLNKVLEAKDPYYNKGIQPMLLKKFGYENTVHIVEREPDCQHFYSFSFNYHEMDFLYWVTNNINYLLNFLEKYKKAAKEVISEAKNPKNRIILPTLSKIELKSQWIEKINQKYSRARGPLGLTKQQTSCLYYLTKGMTIKQIAKALTLAPKTVEHYLDATKGKLNCYSRSELVEYGLQLLYEPNKIL